MSVVIRCMVVIFFFKQKTAYEMRISDWSSDVCSSDLDGKGKGEAAEQPERSAISFRNDPIGESFAINAAELALQFWPVPARRVRNHGICRIAEIGRASCRARVCQYV